MENLIHKVHITSEAVFDYEKTMAFGNLNKVKLKFEIEEYLKNICNTDKLFNCNYFRCKYYDDNSNKMLMIFIYKGKKFGIMQTWILSGICIVEDWNDILEEFGEVKQWLRKEIDNFSNEIDWVIKFRVRKIMKNTNEIFLEDVLKEVQNEFGCERDKKTSERLLLLQSYFFRNEICRRYKRKN